MSGVKYPKGEIVWVDYRNKSGRTIFILTSKEARDFYFLYEIDEGGNAKKLGRAKTPTELEKKYSVVEKMQSE